MVWVAVALAASGVVEVEVVEPVVDAALCACSVVWAALPALVSVAWATAAAWLLLASWLVVCGGVAKGVTWEAAAAAPA